MDLLRGCVTSLDGEAIATSPGTVLGMLPGMSLRNDWGKLRSFQTFIVFDYLALTCSAPRRVPVARSWPRLRQLRPGRFIVVKTSTGS